MRIFFIIFFLLMQNIQAIEIDKKSISTESYFIQVGAFKKMSNIQKVKDRLFEYELYLEPYKDMHRVYIVNILFPLQKETLFQIQKIYPKAFIAKRPRKKNTQSHPMKKTSINFKKSFEPSPSKLNDTQFLNQTLDSTTILKTRKSFL